MTCRSCRRSVAAGSSFCAFCGAQLTDVEAPTIAPFDRTARPTNAPPAARPRTSGQSQPRRPIRHLDFPPGTLLADRYRIVGRIGQGGMGDVYRADDLVLDQPVALKFLPHEVVDDPKRLGDFRAEVRLARQISHPNVCRVYDINEADGHTFLTMEYIDGENLGSLLRRIGRLPHDTAVDMSRQLCAGLAAAHEKGVLHRDLKPANVMIDGAGKVKLADFGLAALAADSDSHTLAGTPAYMAPELFDQQAPSTQSDLYALGLVLYEMFAGKPAFQSTSVAELARLHHETTPTSLSTILADADVTVEKAIQRCLEKDPADRPASALAVSAALPGGDPLAAALAAGETPSPKLVAAAGGVGAIRPLVGAACLAAIFFGLFAVVRLSQSAQAVRYVPLDKAPEVLADQARSMLGRLGLTDTPTDVASGFTDTGYVAYLRAHDLSPTRWDNLRVGQPPAYVYWYRQSPQPLRRNQSGRVTPDEPPNERPGMVTVMLDTQGRLHQLVAVPSAAQASDPGGPPEWSALFREAGLDPAQFTAATPTFTPPVYADARAAWDGVYPDRADVAIHIEGAMTAGRPVFFRIYEPRHQASDVKRLGPALGHQPSDTVGAPNTVAAVILSVLVVGALAGALLLARRNIRLGRGDRVGASRLALTLCLVFVSAGLLRATHSLDLWVLVQTVVVLFGRGLLVGAIAWLSYVALEPDLRRQAPRMLISWSRLLSGRLADPLVGRDILAGLIFGLGFEIFFLLSKVAPAWVGQAPDVTLPFGGAPASRMREVIASIIGSWVDAVLIATTVTLVVFLLTLVLRRRWLVGLVFVGSLTVMAIANVGFTIGLAFVLPTVVVMMLVVLRFGLVAFVVMNYVDPLVDHVPMTFDPGVWYATQSWLVLAAVVGLAVFGYRAAVAGRSVLSPGWLGE